MRSPIVLVVVVLVLAVVVAAFALIGGQQAAGSPSRTVDAGAIAAIAIGLPQAELDQIGNGGLKSGLTSINGARASGAPQVLFMSAEYCPYCAADRWSVVQALGRFGTFTNLSLTTSSDTDSYPGTATFSFRRAKYSSSWIKAVLVETADRARLPLESIPAEVAPTISHFDPSQAIPFVYIDGRYSGLGSPYSPDVLHGLSWTEIAQRLQDPTTSVARGIVGNANQLTAAICQSTGGQPQSVCSSTAVRQAPLPSP